MRCAETTREGSVGLGNSVNTDTQPRKMRKKTEKYVGTTKEEGVDLKTAANIYINMMSPQIINMTKGIAASYKKIQTTKNKTEMNMNSIIQQEKRSITPITTILTTMITETQENTQVKKFINKIGEDMQTKNTPKIQGAGIMKTDIAETVKIANSNTGKSVTSLTRMYNVETAKTATSYTEREKNKPIKW